jgi:hypothetical protein
VTDQDARADETAPLAAIPPAGVSLDKVPAPTTGIVPAVAPGPSLPPARPAPAPATPVVTAPAGWYPHGGGQRYWDGLGWTEHTAPSAVPTYLPAFQAHAVLTDARTNGAEVAIAWVLTVLSLGYFLPWAVAATRGKSNSLAVGLVNFLLGWTLVGWVVALVMACTAHRVTYVQNLT